MSMSGKKTESLSAPEKSGFRQLGQTSNQKRPRVREWGNASIVANSDATPFLG
jgi:hypothetical protein